MNRFPIGPVAVLAVVILLTTPAVLGVRLFQKELRLVSWSYELGFPMTSPASCATPRASRVLPQSSWGAC